MTMQSLMLLTIFLPLVAGVLVFALRRKQLEGVAAGATLVATLATAVLAVKLFAAAPAAFAVPWGGYKLEFALRLYQFSQFIVLAAAGFGLLLALYSVAFMKGKDQVAPYYGWFLLTLGLVNGAALANNLILLLVFWEGLLLTLFGMIAIGHAGAFRTAVKAFVISGVADLCMMGGVILTIHLAGTATISDIHLKTGGLSSLAFVLLMIGATAKAGAMPFHSWIPDAAVDAPLPFMALVPAALEKLLGIYFLARISLDLFALQPGSRLTVLMMVLGCVTILLAVMMALVQKDYKRLLSFHAISQVGYMILGVGTAMPAGIVGGIFHMINHAMYKSCLFLTGGSVEKQAGTTDLRKLGGLAASMPVTFTCFVIAAASISGVPPFNGFFSKELVYDGALERGAWFYGAALLGSFLTAASFLKLGHAAFLGKRGSAATPAVREAPWTMLVPMVALAGLCVLFGLYNALPLRNLVQPVLGARLEGHDFAGFHVSPLLLGLTLVVLAAALVNHLWGAKRAGSGIGASDHIHHAPVLHRLYDWAEQRFFDPYEIGLRIVRGASRVLWFLDRAIDFVYDIVVVRVAQGVAGLTQAAHTGSYVLYLAWALAGMALLALFVTGGI
jgi:NADH-quinone oxidoreductase subunit L